MRGADVTLKLESVMLFVSLLALPLYLALSRFDPTLSILVLFAIVTMSAIGFAFPLINYKKMLEKSGEYIFKLGIFLITICIISGAIVYSQSNTLISLGILVLFALISVLSLFLGILGFRRLEERTKYYIVSWFKAVLKAIVLGLVAYAVLMTLVYLDIISYSVYVPLISYSVFYIFLLLSLPLLLKASSRVSRIQDSRFVSIAGRVLAVLLALLVFTLIPLTAGNYLIAYMIVTLSYAVLTLFFIYTFFKL